MAAPTTSLAAPGQHCARRSGVPPRTPPCPRHLEPPSPPSVTNVGEASHPTGARNTGRAGLKPSVGDDDDVYWHWNFSDPARIREMQADTRPGACPWTISAPNPAFLWGLQNLGGARRMGTRGLMGAMGSMGGMGNMGGMNDMGGCRGAHSVGSRPSTGETATCGPG